MLNYRMMLPVVLAALLSACATPMYAPQGQQDTETPLDLEKIYVRGIFNWWEAEPAYLLSKESSDTYSVTVELIADGQPYDFRLADQYWSPSKSCGAPDIQVVDQGQALVLYCSGDSKNLQFTPQVTGHYKFLVTQTGRSISLIVEQN